jgi:Sec-independent protein secretion pathway component TatC
MPNLILALLAIGMILTALLAIGGIVLCGATLYEIGIVVAAHIRKNGREHVR